jgi:hypothetical protein
VELNVVEEIPPWAPIAPNQQRCPSSGRTPLPDDAPHCHVPEDPLALDGRPRRTGFGFRGVSVFRQAPDTTFHDNGIQWNNWQ